MEKMLTFYCKSNQSYIQGMNEVLAPFLNDYSGKGGLEIIKIYNSFARFVYSFIPNFYLDTDFHSIQASLQLFKLLLKYHEPMLANYLEICNITPDIFAYNWFLTFFSQCLTFDSLYVFWDLLIKE